MTATLIFFVAKYVRTCATSSGPEQNPMRFMVTTTWVTLPVLATLISVARVADPPARFLDGNGGRMPRWLAG